MKNFLTQGEFQEENQCLITKAYKAKEVDSGMRLESQKVDILIKVG